MHTVSGKNISENILQRLASLPKIEKFAAGVLVGDDPASLSFQKIKEKTAKSLGIDYRIFHLAPDLSSQELYKEVRKIAEDPGCGAVILQLPMPKGVDAQFVQNAIPKEKDPDMLSEAAIGAFAVNRSQILQPAAAAVEEILKQEHFDVAKAHVAVIGRGFLIGQPVAMWLLRAAKTLTVLGRDWDPEVLKAADLVVLGTGHQGLLKSAMLKKGAAVVDFGYGAGPDGRLRGDFDPKGAEGLSWYTPTPGGTGPILVAKLFENIYLLNSPD